MRRGFVRRASVVAAVLGGLFVVAGSSPAAALPTPPPLPDPVETTEAPAKPKLETADATLAPPPLPDPEASTEPDPVRTPDSLPTPEPELPTGEPVDCDQFGRVQTYRGWGPALYYGHTVTVAYRIGECEFSVVEGTVEMSVNGSAYIFRGTDTESLIEARGFRTSGTWTDPENPNGWPLAWWECSVAHAELRWEIPGAYVFEVSATDGNWSLDLTVTNDPDGFHWSHNGC